MDRKSRFGRMPASDKQKDYMRKLKDHPNVPESVEIEASVALNNVATSKYDAHCIIERLLIYTKKDETV